MLLEVLPSSKPPTLGIDAVTVLVSLNNFYIIKTVFLVWILKENRKIRVTGKIINVFLMFTTF